MDKRYYVLGVILGKDSVNITDNHVSFMLGHTYLPIIEYFKDIVMNLKVSRRGDTNKVEFDISNEIKYLLDNLENNIDMISQDELMMFILGLIDISGNILTLTENKRNLIDIRCTKNNILDILQEILFNKYQIESILKKYKTKKGDYWELSVVSDNVIKLSRLLESYYMGLNKLVEFKKHLKLSMISNFNYISFKKGQHLTEEQISMIYKLYKEGKSYREIAKILDCSHSSVEYWMRKLGI